MHIAVIGGGITGLTAAYYLIKNNYRVTIFEKEPYLGGLAHGFRAPDWDWHLESSYHHLFTNDHAILSLSRELGLQDNLLTVRPITASLWNGKPYQLDSLLSLLHFPGLSLTDKLRTAVLLGFLKLNPVWRPLESVSARSLIRTVGGQPAYDMIWEPLLYGKFGTRAPVVAASWFWARIVKRTPSLCYIRGGFHTLISTLKQSIKRQGGTICTSVPIEKMQISGTTLHTVYWKNKKQSFDRILLTIPTPHAFKLAPSLPKLDPRYAQLTSIPHLVAQTLILETDAPVLKNVYWLNVTDRSFPFLAAVAHTNFMDPSHYGGRHLTYFGNYLPQGHPYLSMNKKQLLKTFLPYIKRLSHNSLFKIHNSFLFVGPFAQPVHERHYSKKIPPIATSIPGIFMANMDYVVPWDRGTNYAVELGVKATTIIMNT